MLKHSLNHPQSSCSKVPVRFWGFSLWAPAHCPHPSLVPCSLHYVHSYPPLPCFLPRSSLQGPHSSTDVLGAALFRNQRSVKVTISRKSLQCKCSGRSPCQYLERMFHGCLRRCVRQRRERSGKVYQDCDHFGDTSRDFQKLYIPMRKCKNACRILL